MLQARQVFVREYYGVSQYYLNDIAIVVLQTKVILSGIVLPICIHWKNNPTIPNGTLGKVYCCVIFTINYILSLFHSYTLSI